MRQRGFTLVELFVVIAVISILATLAVGYSGNFRKAEYLKEVTRGVVGALNQGRAEAIRRSSKVSVSFSDTVVQAYFDANGNSAFDTGETLVFRFPATGSILSGHTITTRNVALSTTNTAGLNTLIFDYQGYVQDAWGSPVSTVVCVKNTNAADKVKDVRAVQLTAAGASRIQGMAAGQALCP